jgi:hypothetical protein
MAWRSRANWVVYLMERVCCASGLVDVAIRVKSSLDAIVYDSRSDVLGAIDGFNESHQSQIRRSMPTYRFKAL